jgi:hypothetical protein
MKIKENKKAWYIPSCLYLPNKGMKSGAPPVHHPLDAHYYSVVDEPQQSLYLVSPW